MKRSFAVVLGTSLAAAVLGAAPANAQQLTVSDPQGDSSSGLDILGLTVRNADHAVVATLTVEDATRRGDVIISADPRSAGGVRMVAEFRPTAHTDAYLVRKAFTDHHLGHQKLPCPGLKFSQGTSPAGPTLVLRMPSTCLHDGDYGALRFGALVESPNGGGDGDWAPETRRGELGSSDWVARG